MTDDNSRARYILIFLVLNIFIILGILYGPRIFFPDTVVSIQRSEAQDELTKITRAHWTYHEKHGRYPTSSPDVTIFEKIGWEPEGQTPRNTYFCGSDVWVAEYIAFGYVPPFDENWPFNIAPKATQESFTCLALADADLDDFWDIRAVNEKGEFWHWQNDIGNVTKPELKFVIPQKHVWKKLDKKEKETIDARRNHY